MLESCPDNDPCPPACESVFDRVVVSYLVAGNTRVLWELLETFTDAGPLEFQLQVGATANNLADDWEDVGLPVVDQYFAFDFEQRVWGKLNWTHYRVKLTTSRGVYLSLPTGGLGTLERRGWRIAKERVRQRLVAYRVGLGGQRGYLLKRRVTGLDCQVCLDHQTREVRNPRCPSCYGTGKQCGYYYPVSCTWAEIQPGTRHIALDGSQQRGTIADIAVPTEMVMTELLNEDDVWVSDASDDRYYVHEVTHTVEVRGVPVIANVMLRPVPYSSIVYTIAIPDQLRADIVTG